MKTGRKPLRDKVFAALPGTLSQIERKSGASGSSVTKWIAVFKREQLIHIGGWRRSQSAMQPVYVLGYGEDKPRPRPYTDSELQARFRKKNPERRAEVKRKSAARCKMRKHGCGWMAALVF